MTTATMTAGQDAAFGQPTLEALVDRMMDALFARNCGGNEAARCTETVVRAVHDARRLRQAGDVDGALAALADANTASADTREARWAYAEWLGLVKRRFRGQPVAVYSPGTGRAAALVDDGGGALRVAATLGMAWPPGKTVSRRSLRGLRPLAGGGVWC